MQNIASVALVVKNYDEAIDFYTNKVGFELVEDTDFGNGKRWVVVAPKNTQGTSLLLAQASNKQQENAIGNQSGGRVFLFLQTDDFYRDFQFMTERGVRFEEKPREEEYGIVAIFSDLYGNKWDLIERF